MINLPQTDQVLHNCLLGMLYQEEIGYCHQWVNVIALGLAQSDHIKWPPLYQHLLTAFKTQRKVTLVKYIFYKKKLLLLHLDEEIE